MHLSLKHFVFMYIKIALIFLMTIAQAGLFSNAEARGDEDYHRDILRALKKINARLIFLENDKLRSIQSVQENLLNQIMTIRTSIEQIQATGEINKSEMLANVGALETKILDVESHLKNEVMQKFDNQKQGDKKFHVEFSARFDQLQNGLATDMESFSKANEQNFTIFNEGNKEKLQQIIYALNAQTEKLKQTQDVFKTDLIPALDKQSEAVRQDLMAELKQARAVHENSLKSNHEQVVAAWAKMDDDNKKLIGILKKSIMVNEEIKNLANAIQQNIGGTNKNLDQTRQALEQVIGDINNNIDQTRQAMSVLHEVLTSRLQNLSNERTAAEVRFNKELAEIKENQKNRLPQLKTLADASRQISERFTQLQQDLMKSIEAIDSNKVQTGLANEKLSKLINILKAIVVEQGKIDQVLRLQEKLDVVLQAQGKVGQAMQGQAQGKIDQVLQEMEKLDLLLQAQEQTDQELQGRELKSITSQAAISQMQQEIKDSLRDLRRKANVNISRNDDILKKIKKRK